MRVQTAAVATPIRGTEAVTWFTLLLGASVLVPMLGLHQLVTGTVVNAALIVATVRLGPRAAVSIGVLPSLFALVFGQLPAVLAPMVPFIIVGNIVLVVVFHRLRSRGFWLGAGAAALLKSGWLYATSAMLFVLLPLEAPAAVVAMMSWPQLVTALTGAMLAFGVLGLGRSR